MRVQLNPESSGGGGSHAVNATEPTVTQSQAAPPPAVAPPAAETVLHGELTEDTLKLRETISAKDAEIEELKRQVRDREITVCDYQDKLEALKTAAPVAVRRKAPEARPFRIGRFV